MNRPTAPSWMPFALALGVAGLAAFAQYQVNRQVYGSSGPSMSSVRYAPQHLGVTAAPSSANLLPSEVRNAYVRSGELPSNIKAGYNAVGPLAPGGAMSYLPPAPSYGSRGGPPGPQGNLVNPMVGGGFTQTSPYAAPASGSIRYAGTVPAVAPSYTPLRPVAQTGGLSQPVNPSPYTGSIGNTGGMITSNGNPFDASVRYNR